MIKYLGSKRVQVPVLGAIASAVQARTALDLFTGTTRVAQEFKSRGIFTTAVDLATYSEVFAQCYIETDAAKVSSTELADALAQLNSLPGVPGYFTRTFCEEARFFQPKNGARIDAIRDALASDFATSPLYPILLTSLIEAADRVDSTTGLQMAFLKSWAPRANADLELRAPVLLAGDGKAIRGDALEVVEQLAGVDLAYLDPPYNQHRYFTNYHIWETLVRWDQPAAYGVARKREDARGASSRSRFNSKPEMPTALAQVIQGVSAKCVVVSYNNESWVSADQIAQSLRDSGHEYVSIVDFDYKRYVGAQIGIHNPAGERVGKVSHLRNVEHVVIAGERDRVEAAVAAASATKN